MNSKKETSYGEQVDYITKEEYDELMEVLQGIKKGLDDFKEGRYTVENY